jgi:ubiquinone/menaquinone biosynthesis C-methylase UbiE
MSCLSRLFKLFSRLLMVFVVIEVLLRVAKRFWHIPAPAFMSAVLNSRARRAIQPPGDLMTWLGLRPGMHVLEIGPGPGTFTLEAARRVGPEGKVTAVEIAPQMLARLAENSRRAAIENIDAQLSSAYQLPVADHSVDRVFLVTVLAEVPDPQRALGEIWRVLKPGGKLGVGEMLLDPDFPLPQTVTRWCREAGFQLVDLRGNALHYLAIFQPVD